MKKPLFLSSLVFLIAGWGTTPPPTPLKAETPFVVAQLSPDSTDNVAEVQEAVELLDPGIQPRRQLRFTPAANTRQTTVLTMNMNMRGTVNGQVMPVMDFPAIEITMEAEVPKVDANGDSYINLSYSNIDLASGTTAPPEVVNAMRSQFKKIMEMKISYVIDNQGKTKDMNVVLPEDIDPNLQQFMEQLLKSLEQISVSPFPEEPVGIGAQWLVSSSIPHAGLPLNEVRVLYQLVNFQDDAIVLNVSLQQEPDPQSSGPLNLPGLPPDIDFNIQSFGIQSSGTMTMRLDQIMPLSGIMSTLATMEFTIKDPNSEQEMRMNTISSVEMTMESQ